MNKIKIIALLFTIFKLNFGFCQPTTTSPGSIEIKTIPDTIYDEDFVRFEVFAQFISGSGTGSCYIKSYSIDKINDTIFLNIHYYNSKDQHMCQTKDTITFDSLLVKGKYQLNFKGSAGQSFGAFSSKGLKLVLKGDANDYVGKGLSGATISIKLSDESNLISNENTIIGNTVLYGATSGKLFAAGQAGERFAVRNSGATTVIEGCDSNGCEYMTGGTVVILGDVGDNFAAGMTGGMAFIYDKSREFEKKVNNEDTTCGK